MLKIRPPFLPLAALSLMLILRQAAAQSRTVVVVLEVTRLLLEARSAGLVRAENCRHNDVRKHYVLLLLHVYNVGLIFALAMDANKENDQCRPV